MGDTGLLVSHAFTEAEIAEGELYRPVTIADKPVSVKAIPYYAWGNRYFDEMIVWFHRNGFRTASPLEEKQ